MRHCASLLVSSLKVDLDSRASCLVVCELDKPHPEMLATLGYHLLSGAKKLFSCLS